MENTLYIAKNKTLLPAQDYAFLRSKGLEYIESLASDLWTDYNTHDPGITILEALCYAITELGYKTSFDIKDLMSDENGKIDAHQTFFTAKNILPNKALTINDYRKLLIDVPGVRNAWLFPQLSEDGNKIGAPMQEVNIYADCENNALTYQQTDHFIQLHGLYHVLLDLEENDIYGDLNNGNLFYKFPTTHLLENTLEIFFPRWNDIDYAVISKINPETISNIRVTPDINKWTVTFLLGTETNKQEFSFTAIVLLKKNISEIAEAITTGFSKAATVAEIFSLYQQKLALVISILQNAKSVLHANRNLCEDFAKLETVQTQEITLCASIQIQPEADMEQVYAHIIFQLENYLNPEIKFYSLKELINKNMPTDEIFEGPLLQHGFIKTAELENTRLRTELQVSDIINFIMNTPGVISVKDVLLTKYHENGDAIFPSERWSLKIDKNRKPVLNHHRSKVLFLKGKLPFKPNTEEVSDTLKFLHAKEQQNKLQGSANDLAIPTGNYRNIKDYISVQHEFPETYAIGNAGLPSSGSTQRRAQSKQLKAYLLFYDQVLANFFAQLHNAKNLFSTDSTIKQTYFANYMHTLKGTDTENGMQEAYINAGDIEKICSSVPGEEDALKNLFSQLIENKESFYTRRNRFLDHLVSRFAESFNTYTLMLYRYNGAEPGASEKIAEDELIDDKINFLKTYPEVSSERGKSFDYLNKSGLWDTTNVSGFEKRIAAIAGIDDFKRRFLFCFNHIEIQKTNEDPPLYYFEMKDEDTHTLITSIKNYASFSEINTIVQLLPDALSKKNRYLLTNSVEKFSFSITDDNKQEIAKSGMVYETDIERDAAIKNIIGRSKKDCPAEGLHAVEHILLRPRFVAKTKTAEYKLLQVCLPDNCTFCGEEDPYSFRITLILPYWHERFRDLEYRKYFEDMARTEAPAHCLVKICWVYNTQLHDFEIAYKKWLAALAEYEADFVKKEKNKKLLMEASNELITQLEQLNNQYPPAQLHNCDTGNTNPVLLGNTALGNFLK